MKRNAIGEILFCILGRMLGYMFVGSVINLISMDLYKYDLRNIIYYDYFWIYFIISYPMVFVLFKIGDWYVLASPESFHPISGRRIQLAQRLSNILVAPCCLLEWLIINTVMGINEILLFVYNKLELEDINR